MAIGSRYVKGVNVCAMSKLAGCRETCLVWAGRGSFKPVIDARTRKTVLYRDNKQGFMSMLRGDIYAFIEDCKRFKLKPAIRLNVISDINFLEIIKEFPTVQFYALFAVGFSSAPRSPLGVPKSPQRRTKGIK